MSEILSNEELEVIFMNKGDLTLEQAEQIIETLKVQDIALYPKCKELGLSEKTAKRIGSQIKAHGYVFSQKLKRFVLESEKAELESEHDKSKQKKSPATKPKTKPKTDVIKSEVAVTNTDDILARLEQLESQVKSLNAIKEELKSNHRTIKEELKTTHNNLEVRTLDGEWKNKNYCIYPETEQRLNELYSKYKHLKRTDIINTLLLDGIDKYL